MVIVGLLFLMVRGFLVHFDTYLASINLCSNCSLFQFPMPILLVWMISVTDSFIFNSFNFNGSNWHPSHWSTFSPRDLQNNVWPKVSERVSYKESKKFVCVFFYISGTQYVLRISISTHCRYLLGVQEHPYNLGV